MIKKTFFLIVFFSFTTFNITYSQSSNLQFDVFWGPSIKDNQYESYQSILDYRASGFFAIKSNGYNSFALEKFNANLERVKSYDYKKYIKSNKLRMPDIISLDGDLIFLSSKSDLKSGKGSLLVQKIDKNTLSPIGTLKQILTVDYSLPKVVSLSQLKEVFFQYRVSSDSSKLLVFYEGFQKGKKTDKIELIVLDKSLNKLWEKQVDLPFLEKDFDVLNFKIDNKANVFILGKKWMPQSKNNFDFVIFKFSENESVKKYYPKSKGGFIKSLIIKIDENGNLICSGFWGEKKSTALLGCYFMKIDGTSGNITQEASQVLEAKVFESSLSKKEIDKIKKEGDKVRLDGYKLNEMILVESGGAVVVAEHQYNKTYTNYSFGTSSTSYGRSDLVVIRISNQGDILWVKKVRKAQSSSIYTIVGYSTIVVGNKAIFIYNDHPKNLVLPKDEKPKPINPKDKDTVVAMEVISIDGTVSKQHLFGKSDTEVITVPKLSFQVAENKFLIFGQTAKIRKFGLLTF